ARAAECRAVPRAARLQEEVVVRVLVARLQNVVVDVRDADAIAHAGHAEAHELLPDHRPGRVLDEGLVDRDRDFLAGHGAALDEMRLDDLLGEGPSHGPMVAEAARAGARPDGPSLAPARTARVACGASRAAPSGGLPHATSGSLAGRNRG